jgi:hypothetical protein
LNAWRSKAAGRTLPWAREVSRWVRSVEVEVIQNPNRRSQSILKGLRGNRYPVSDDENIMNISYIRKATPASEFWVKFALESD